MNIHDFFYFLWTPLGDFVKRSVEFLFLILVTYMVISEHQRERTRELKYLSLAFGILAIQKFVTAMYLFAVIYSDLPFEVLNYVMPVIENGLEIMGLILLASAFIYPYYKGNLDNLRASIKISIFVSSVAALLVEAVWFIELLENPHRHFDDFSGSIIFIAVKMMVLAFPIIYLSFITVAEFKFMRNFVIAYATYLIVPMLQLVNLVFFENTSR